MFLNYVERFGRLFLIVSSALSIVVYYFLDNFPDNYYKVSSSGELPNYFLYILSSSLFSIHYWVGIWIVIPLFFHLSLLIFQNKGKLGGHAPFLILSLTFTLLTLTVCWVFYSYLLGDGLRNLMSTQFDNTNIPLVAASLFGILFLAQLFRIFRPTLLKVDVPSLNSLPKITLPKVQLPSIFKFKKDLSSEVNNNQELLEIIPKSNSKFEQVASVEEEYEEEIELESEDGVETEDVLDEDNVEEKPANKNREKSNIKKVLSLKRANTTGDDNYFQLMGDKKLHSGPNQNSHPNQKYFEDITMRIENKLEEIKIDGRIENVLKGPVVDTFELSLGSGVKVSKVNSSSEDLSLALYGAPIRVVYPMKGRTTIGIEVPRNPREIIYLDEIVSSTEFQKTQHLLPLAMGKDSFGKPFVVDLANMPHMLVAGATGAGKSVFINSILVSLLIKKSPRQMKLILIDPKQLELALYSSLPHLLTPVITDSKSACITLMWVVQEMERRYSILKEFGVRNIEGFNKKIRTATPEMLGRIHQFYQDNSAEEYELPFIVVIIDEFADLILTKAGKEIENNICRLAAKARASGIHLIIATQRPSVDVITGLIKSNFPTRVSFRVTTSVDSRTILNAIGAERLLGKGDMLYKHGVETVRIHSSYVSEDEIETLISNLGSMGQTFDPSAMEFVENGGPNEFGSNGMGLNFSSDGEGGDQDDLYDEAVKVVIECRSASASMLQRRLKVGYNRAANLIEVMESKGVVGPAQGSKPRKVLLESNS